MGFLGALYLGLFVWCLRRNVDKKEALYRFITLTSGAIVNVGIAAIISALGTTPEDKEGAWVVIPIYFIVFGWRIVLDIISYSKKRSTPQIRKQPKSTNNISKLCSMGMMVGCAGVALFLGIVLVSLIIYGRVYLFDGYDYTKVLVVLSLICMFIGICSLVGKACTTSKTTQQSSSNDDETVRKILLYKDLLDRGAITAEEYEEKKRQILGL